MLQTRNQPCYTDGMDDDYLTTKEAGEFLGVGDQRIRDLIREGRLPNAKKRGGIWFVPLSDLENFERKKPWDIRKEDEKST